MFCCGATAQLHQLAVTVTDDHNKPVAGVRVFLEKEQPAPLPGPGGLYVFKALPAGDYHLQVSAAGYQSFEERMTITGHDLVLRVILRTEIRLLEEVVVHNNSISRQKKQEALNLEIVKSDYIQKNLGGSLMQSLERLPGVKTIGIGSGQSKPLIRGLGFNRVVVIDRGVKHEGQQWGADHGLEIDQFAAGEVEIIKGAASFVYGSDAIAGAIYIRPPALPVPGSLGGDLQLVGKTNNALYGGSLNLYGRTRKWFVTGRGSYQDYGDYRVPATRLYVYDYPVYLHRNYLRNTAGNEAGLHISTGYITDRLRSVFYISNINSKSGFFANAHGLEPRRVDTVLHDHSNRDLQMPHQQVNHFKVINRSYLKISDRHLELELAYQHNVRREYNPYVNHGYMPPVYPAKSAIPETLERQFLKNVYSVNVNDRLKWKQQEFRFGINGEVQNNRIGGWSFLVPAFDQKTIGAFVYDRFRFNERTLLHGALRYDCGAIRIHRYTDWFATPYIGDGDTSGRYMVRAAGGTRNFNSITGSAGVNYNTEKWALKASIGKSFRMPIAKELGANGVNYHYFSYERGNAGLAPETSYQLDAGAAFTKAGWQVQLSPFLNYFPNYIYLNPTADHDYLYGAGNQVFEYRQSRVLRYGAELEISFRFRSDLSATALGEYLYAEQLSGDKRGYSLPFSPPPSLLLNLAYQPARLGPFKHTYFSVDYRIAAAQNNIVPPEKKTAGYRLMHIQAGTGLTVQRQQLQLSMQLQNVFNTRYLNHTSFYRLIGLPEQGRNFILVLKIPFNFLNNK